jgi:DNA-binding transcriptional MocR family regulator
LSLPEGLDSSDLMEDAAAAGVLYTPGRLLFVGDGASHLRLTFGKVPTDEVDEGVRRLARVIRRALGRRSERPRSHRRRTLPPV